MMMWYSTALVASTASLLFSIPVEASIYSKNSPVLQVTSRTYDRLIAKSNHTSVVEFYAPWCGHCQNLKPAYEKAAKNLKGLAKVAAVNCDDDLNKGFCGTMGVKGFPTLKIVRPSIKKGGQPSVDDYQGARTAKAIVDAVVEKIPNHVKRVTDKTLDGWLKEDNDTAKAILFSDKATTSALLRALAVDFLGSISFGQIRDKEKEAVESFGITSYPKFVLLPGGDKEGIVYDGKLEKDAMSEFVSQVASPNPDPAPEEPKKKAKKSKKDETKAEKASASFSKESAKHKASDASSAKLKSTSVSLDEQPTESPDPKVDSPPSVKVDPVPMISVLGTESAVREKCLSPSSRICALVLLPSKSDSDALFPQEVSIALRGLGEVYEKHSKRKAAFPFYAVEPSNPLAATIRDALGLKSEQELEIIAVNAKRSWWRKYSGKDYGHDSIENWVDTIRMNEGKKEKLPESLLIETTEALNEEKKAEEEKKEEKKKAEEEEKERDEL